QATAGSATSTARTPNPGVMHSIWERPHRQPLAVGIHFDRVRGIVCSVGVAVSVQAIRTAGPVPGSGAMGVSATMLGSGHDLVAAERPRRDPQEIITDDSRSQPKNDCARSSIG